MHRKNISSGSPWEDIVGYSRAVVVGQKIHLSGTTATDGDGNVIGVGNPFEQTRYIIEKVGRILSEAGSSLDNVVWTRMYVTDIKQWREVGKAHSTFFHEIKPVTTMVEVSRLIDADMLIEIEFEAYLN